MITSSDVDRAKCLKDLVIMLDDERVESNRIIEFLHNLPEVQSTLMKLRGETFSNPLTLREFRELCIIQANKHKT